MAIVEMAVMCLAAAVALASLGELTPDERQLAVSLVRRSSVDPQAAGSSRQADG
jgi:hypothetical protein